MKKAVWPWMLGVCVVLLVVAASFAPGVKQRLLPAYGTPERVQAIFPEQIAALRAVAEGRQKPEQVASLFSESAIHGAHVVNRYGDSGGRALELVKPYTSEWEIATESGIWFPAEPGLGDPVVNIWGGRSACFELKFRTSTGIKGMELWVDVGHLKRSFRNLAPELRQRD